MALLLQGAAEAQTLTATVISIGDGDTLRVREANRTVNVRLACIDAPESSQAPFGTEARKQLQELAPVGSAVELRIKATDRYGRSVAELTRGGRNLNQALVALGAAFVYWPFINGCDRQTYGRMETEARLKGRGVWGVSGGVTRPWDFRKRQRSQSEERMGTSPALHYTDEISSLRSKQVSALCKRDSGSMFHFRRIQTEESRDNTQS
ncbi:MAG: thermonuclease family protein [Vulcanococcus sp.]